MPREKKRPPLSEAQLEIMQIVWQRRELTVTDVWQELAQQRPVARNTVLTVMDRLEKRGWLTKRAVGNTHLYRAAATQRETLGKVVERLVDTVFGGSAESLVMALLEGRGVSRDEARRIRKRIDAAREERRGDAGKRRGR
jgi:predicted transcriptional regulator